MTGWSEAPHARWFFGLGIVGITLLLLIYGRSFLLPLVCAFLVFTLLTAAIERLSRIRIGRFPLPYWAAAFTGLAATGALIFISYTILSGEIVLLIAAWPRIVERAQTLLLSLSDWLGQDLVAAVRTAQGDFNVVANLRGLLSPVGFVLTSIVVIVLYVAFMFVESAHFPAKFARLFPDAKRAAEISGVFRQIVASLHRYLLLKTLISIGNTLVVYALLKVVGVEFAETWAILTFFLNYVPNIGSIAATVIPSLFALVQFQEFGPTFIVTAGLTAIHFSIGHAIDPMVMGRTLNLSTLVIMLALTFWAAVWGIMGMFLAVPLMVVVMIICAKIPALRPVAILLSSDGTLPGEASPETAKEKSKRHPGRKAR